MCKVEREVMYFFFFQAEDGIRDKLVTGVQTCALPISFVNTIEDYPYPYVINRLCWEFPCMTPSDWQANHLHSPNNPITVQDWKAALDATVIKRGVMTMVFHPHGWIRNDQLVDLIDYAVTKY